MLKYITTSGIVLIALFALLEISVNVLGNMIKTKKETGISIKNQIANAIKKDKNKIK